MSTLAMLVGNVGCGKGVIAGKLAYDNYVCVNMDRLQAMFANGVYGRYDNAKKAVYHRTEDAAIESALESGLSVVIDRTNMNRKSRERFMIVGKRYKAECVAYDFGSGNEETLSRRLENPRDTPIADWYQVHNFMSKIYEKPSLDEGFDRIVQVPNKYRFYAFDFDGTIVENKFPNIGNIIPKTVDKMNSIFDDISNILIIWTNRSGDYERQMKQFLIREKIPFDFINENPIWEGGSRKIFAHEYYDDHNVCLEG